MKKGILGRKLGMSQIFMADGRMIPVTVIEAAPNTVVQIKTVEKEGYNAVQVGYGDVKQIKENTYKGVGKQAQGHFKQAGVAPKKVLREFRFDDISSYKVGDTIACNSFAVGDIVDVVGKSKGKGYAGVIKRWNAQRVGSMSHGTGPIHRSVGSMAANSDPSRVFKNKHMAGELGNERVTIKNLEIVRVDEARNLLFIKGGVPGAKGTVVVVKA